MTTIVQNWNDGVLLDLGRQTANLYEGPPRVGIVVGTYAAVPYVHLQLEARRRIFPTAPLLVHDDGSHKTEELADLCRRYDCDFEHNSTRQPPCVGDLTAYLGGLKWAESRGVDLLVKVSRRWLFLVDWVASLQELAVQSQYATFCSYTTTFGFGFRTECMGMSVRQWNGPLFLDDVTAHIQRGRGPFVEAYMHDFARHFERLNGPVAERWRAAHPMPADRSGYALWTLMGTDRCERSTSFLWHDGASPADYCRVARQWGLEYNVDDFADPNQGGGNGL